MSATTDELLERLDAMSATLDKLEDALYAVVVQQGLCSQPWDEVPEGIRDDSWESIQAWLKDYGERRKVNGDARNG